VGRFLG
jgi:hypothetical protein